MKMPAVLAQAMQQAYYQVEKTAVFFGTVKMVLFHHQLVLLLMQPIIIMQPLIIQVVTPRITTLSPILLLTSGAELPKQCAAKYNKLYKVACLDVLRCRLHY